MITKESFSIFWNTGEGQEEVDGLIFYGLWQHGIPHEINIQEFKNIWSSHNEIKCIRWENEDYKTLSVEVLINYWPNCDKDWDATLLEALRWFTDNGAVISWCGDEYSSPNPEIFAPNNNIGSIYAAWHPKSGIICNSKLSDELLYLSDEQLSKYYSFIL